MKTISDAIKTLIRQEPYYGIFAMTLNKYFTEEIPTAAVKVEGINIELLINKDFWYGLTPKVRIGLLKHELMHICFEHYAMWDEYPDHQRLNIAQDLEINSWIGKDNLPAGGCFVESFGWEPHKGTRWYYNEIGKRPDLMKKLGNGSGNGSRQNNNGNSGEGEPKNRNKEGSGSGTLRTTDDHSLMESTMKGLSDTQKQLIKSQATFQMKEAAKQVIKSRGTIPGELQVIIDELFKVKKPVFNWKAYFRRLLGVNFDIYQKKTRRKESLRFEDCPGLKRKKKHKILVAIDTSGSVSEKEFVDFFSEIHHIHKAGANIHILEADMRITNEYDYNGKMPKKISGRGGTSFTECVDWYNKYRKDYTVMVYFTDGYGDQNECKPIGKMIWIITSDGNQESEFPGFKVCIPKENDY